MILWITKPTVPLHICRHYWLIVADENGQYISYYPFYPLPAHEQTGAQEMVICEETGLCQLYASDSGHIYFQGVSLLTLLPSNLLMAG
jgi:hypothetical protein